MSNYYNVLQKAIAVNQDSKQTQATADQNKRYFKLLSEIKRLQSLNERRASLEAKLAAPEAYKQQALRALSRYNYSDRRNNFADRRSCCGTGIGGGYCCALWRVPGEIEAVFTAICVLMNKAEWSTSWKNIYRIIHRNKKDFLSSVLKFDAKDIKEQSREETQIKLMAIGRQGAPNKLWGDKLRHLVHGYIRQTTLDQHKAQLQYFIIPLEINDMIVVYCTNTIQCDGRFINLWENDMKSVMSNGKWYDAKYGPFLLWIKAQCNLAHTLDSTGLGWTTIKELRGLDHQIKIKQKEADSLLLAIVDRQ